MKKSLGEQLMGILTPEEALANMKTATERCLRFNTAQSAEWVCRQSREVWNAFEGQLIGSPHLIDRQLAKEAAHVIAEGIRAIETVLSGQALSTADLVRLQKYAATVQKRMKDLETLADGGPSAVDARIDQEFLDVVKSF